jgi:hypothetical protein
MLLATSSSLPQKLPRHSHHRLRQHWRRTGLPDITSVFSYKISLAFQNACSVKCHQTLKDTKSEVFILLATLAAAAGGAFRPPALHVGGIFFSLLLFPPGTSELSWECVSICLSARTNRHNPIMSIDGLLASCCVGRPGGLFLPSPCL